MTAILAAGVILSMASFPPAAQAGLCADCRDKVFIQNVGACTRCGAATTSGAFKLCRKCSAEFRQCEACGAALPAAGAAGDARPVPRAIEVGEGTTGRYFELVPGQELVVHLQGNPTTGYTWVLAPVDARVLKAPVAPEFVPANRDARLVGQGGEFVTRFTAVAVGETAVRFDYCRPWEKDTPAVKSFSLTVRVKPDGKTGSSPRQ
jgi:inhibitor of cysteine peptidase